MMTLAPELTGSAEVIDLLDHHGIAVAIGHTEADPATVRDTLTRARTAVVTHLFNGMPPIHHRDPGPALSAMASARAGTATLELIADGVHVADETIAGVWTLLGADRIGLVSDAMAAAGLPDGFRVG